MYHSIGTEDLLQVDLSPRRQRKPSVVGSMGESFNIWGFPKNRGAFTTKMDGEHNGKPY